MRELSSEQIELLCDGLSKILNKTGKPPKNVNEHVAWSGYVDRRRGIILDLLDQIRVSKVILS